MDRRDGLLRLAVRGSVGLIVAAILLTWLFLVVGAPARAGEARATGGFSVASSSLGDLKPQAVATWGEFTPTQWITTSLVTSAVSVTDVNGLQEMTAQYRYSTNGGSTWFSWGNANLTIYGELATSKRMTVTNLFLPDGSTTNLLMFRIRDGAAVTETSDPYPVHVDLTPPDSTVTTSGWFDTLSEIEGTATDNASGVAHVDLRIRRSSDNQYYNGASWQASAVWLAATGTTSWNYPFSASDTVTYTVESRATDVAGLVESSYGTGTIAFDKTAPTSAVGTNGYYRTATWTGYITGTASDVGSGVATVEITLQRTSDNLSYNGSGWQASATWLLATGANAWSYPFAPTPGVTYQVRSRATDVKGNQQATYGTGSFTLDLGLPTSTVGTTGYYGSVTWTGYITGTASDVESDIARVDITIRRASDSLYWNGSWWQASPVWLLATGATAWHYPLTPSHSQTYIIQARAQDLAGNQQSPPSTGQFTYDSGLPTSSVTTSGLIGSSGWTGEITGLASDDLSGLQVVDITIRRQTDNLYFDGVSWGSPPAWLAATGTNAWRYAFSPTQGITYTVQSRATDRAGNVQTAYGTSSFAYDGTAPTATINTSGYFGPVTWTGSITGSAAEAESGLQSVLLSIRRLSDNLYWNGSTWQVSEAWLAAMLNGTDWSYGFTPQDGRSYQVRAKATDTAGNSQLTPSSATFSYDASNPTSTIDTEGFYRFETWTGQIAGTASDSGSSVSRVELTLRRSSDSRYYNGTSWQIAINWLEAVGATAWTYAFAPTDGITYTVQSRATDVAGNVQSPVDTATICYDLQPPDSQVGTHGYYNSVTWTNAITGTATDSTSGVLGVAITVQRASDNRYWNGSAWQVAQNWITATGSLNWSYPFAGSSGITYTVRSRAVDKAGNTETTYGQDSFAIDSQEPDSQVGTVGFFSAATWTGAITGTATAGISGVDRVDLTIRRSTDNQYYNGSAWQAAALWLPATGGKEWGYAPFTPVEGVTYTVRSRAWSGSGMEETTPGQGQFSFDGGPPSVMLGTSGAYRTATWTGVITGTAADPGSGVDYVEFTLRRGTDNRYYTGSAWGTTATWLMAVGAEEWQYTFAPPGEAIYTLQLRPADKAGNVLNPPATATFVYDNTAPFPPLDPHYNDGWQNTNAFTVTWTVPPDLSGIGGAYYKFTRPNSATDGTFVATTNIITNISVPREGLWDLYLWLRDNAGNVNQNNRVERGGAFRFDATAPTTAHAFAGPAGDNGWFQGTVTVTLDAQDQAGLSGVDERYYKVGAGTWMTTTSTFLVSGNGVHDFQYYSTDLAGNVEPTHSVTVGIDTVAPSVSHAISGTVGASGWYTAPVTVILDATDATSGVDPAAGYRHGPSATGPWSVNKTFPVSGEGTRAFYYYATDRAGNESGVVSGTVKIDTVAPTTAISVTGLIGDNGWYRGTPVGVTIRVTDTTSGPQSGEVYHKVDSGPWVKGYMLEITTDGDHVVEHYAVDNAGNRGQPAVDHVKVDTVAPAAPTGLVPLPAGWTNVDSFSLSWTSPTDTSGIAGAYYKLDAEPTSNTDGIFAPGADRIDNIQVLSAGSHTVALWLRDRAGNVRFLNRAVRINAFRYDPTPPLTNASLVGTAGKNDWFISNVTVNLTAQDQVGLSGVAGVSYRVGATDWITQTGASASTVVNTPGKRVVEFRSKDVAGNVEQVRTVTVRMDNVPPGAPTGLRVTPYEWSKGSTFTLTWRNPIPADHSGIGALYYKLGSPPTSATDGTRVAVVLPTATLNVTTDGSHNLYVWLEDGAGNVGHQNYAWLPNAIRRDTEPPEVSHALVGTLGNNNWYVTPVTVNFTATDNASGVASVQYRVDGGTWKTGLSAVVWDDGEHTVQYRATDVAGNQSAVVTVPFKVDHSAPTVYIKPVHPAQTERTFTVSWLGADPHSGLTRYDVQVADGIGGAWVDWLTNTEQTSGQYTGQRGHTYLFRARARDVAGNVGDYPSSAQLLVQISPIVNGTFDSGNANGWTLACTPSFNRGVLPAPTHLGGQSWMMRLGDPNYGIDNVPVGAACMSQTFTVPTPDQVLAPRLTFWYHIYTYDIVVGGDGVLYDSFDVTVTRGGSTQLVLRDGNWTQPVSPTNPVRYDLGWRFAEINLAPYAGQTITVQFANWNREKDPKLTIGWYNTWTLVDDVRIGSRPTPKVRLPTMTLDFSGTLSAGGAATGPEEALPPPATEAEGDRPSR